MVRTIIVACLAILALTACQAEVQKMSADAIRSTFVDVTDYGTLANGEVFVAYLGPDGAVRMRHGGLVQVGQYRIQPDGEVCFQYEAPKQGSVACQIMYKGVNKYYSTLSNGQPGVIITTVRPGNVEHL